VQGKVRSVFHCYRPARTRMRTYSVLEETGCFENKSRLVEAPWCGLVRCSSRCSVSGRTASGPPVCVCVCVCVCRVVANETQLLQNNGISYRKNGPRLLLENIVVQREIIMLAREWPKTHQRAQTALVQQRPKWFRREERCCNVSVLQRAHISKVVTLSVGNFHETIASLFVTIIRMDLWVM
jgi:hypothetical protein